MYLTWYITVNNEWLIYSNVFVTYIWILAFCTPSVYINFNHGKTYITLREQSTSNSVYIYTVCIYIFENKNWTDFDALAFKTDGSNCKLILK